MEDEIRNLLWAFLGSSLSALFILSGWFMCLIAPVCDRVVLAIVGLGIIISVLFLIVLLGVLDDRDYQRKSAKRIKELDEFGERMRGGNHE